MITVTNAARHKLKELFAGTKRLALNIEVAGGGCSGLQYVLSIISEDIERLVLFRDPLICTENSAKYLTDITLDYDDSLTHSGFKINNSKAAQTCGCGKSFEVI